jgi:hypothetical protein
MNLAPITPMSALDSLAGAPSSAAPRIRLVPRSDQPSEAAAQNILDTWEE